MKKAIIFDMGRVLADALGDPSILGQEVAE